MGLDSARCRKVMGSINPNTARLMRIVILGSFSVSVAHAWCGLCNTLIARPLRSLGSIGAQCQRQPSLQIGLLKRKAWDTQVLVRSNEYGNLELDEIVHEEDLPVRKHIGRKTIGVDYGLKRTGICVSVGYAPRPLPLFRHDNEVRKTMSFRNICQLRNRRNICHASVPECVYSIRFLTE
jgi:hypothetical protein